MMGMMIFLARTVLVRGIVMVWSKMIVRMLGLSVMHVWVVVVIAIGSIIDGIVVVVSIIARFILHIPVLKKKEKTQLHTVENQNVAAK